MQKAFRSFTLTICLTATTALAICPGPSEPKPSDPKQAILCEGLDHFYNSEERLASADFDRYIALDPESPTGYWRKLLSEYIAIRDEQHTDTPMLSPAEYKTDMDLARIGLDKAMANIGNGKMPGFNQYVAANILGILAALQAKNVGWFTAYRTMIRAIQLAEQSRYQEAALFLGAVNYKMSEHSFTKNLVRSIPHDREKGRMLIVDSVMQNDSPFVDDGWFAVLALKIKEEPHGPYEGTELKRIWRYLYKRYPRSRILLAYREQAQ